MSRNTRSILHALLTNLARIINFDGRLYRDVMRIKVALAYIKFIRIFRLLFMSMLGIGICINLLFGGLALFYVTFFLYTPFSQETKMWVGFASAALFFGVAVKTFSYFFDPRQWLKIFHADHVLKELDRENVVNNR